jgi:hypothetical protein
MQKEVTQRSVEFTYLLCGILGSILLFSLYSWEWLANFFRDEHLARNWWFSVVIICILFLFNTAVVSIMLPRATLSKKASIWVKATIFSFLCLVALLFLVAIYIFTVPR